MKKDQRSILRKGISFLVEKADGRFGSEERTLRYECIHTPKIPKSFDGYRILQLSDLHGQGIESAADSLFETVIETRPNLICLTGDYIRNEYDAHTKRELEPFFRRLGRIAPTYAIEGNHENRIPEGRELMRDMKHWGIHVLWDRGLFVEENGEHIGLAGLRTYSDSRLFPTHRPDERLLRQGERAMRLFAKEDFVVLLGHCPEKIREYHRMGADLVLSGHAHGGLLLLPNGRALLAPGQGFFPRYTRGLYHYRGTEMEVSAGLGGPRIGIPKEIVCIELRKE